MSVIRTICVKEQTPVQLPSCIPEELFSEESKQLLDQYRGIYHHLSEYVLRDIAVKTYISMRVERGLWENDTLFRETRLSEQGIVYVDKQLPSLQYDVLYEEGSGALYSTPAGVETSRLEAVQKSEEVALQKLAQLNAEFVKRFHEAAGHILRGESVPDEQQVSSDAEIDEHMTVVGPHGVMDALEAANIVVENRDEVQQAPASVQLREGTTLRIRSSEAHGTISIVKNETNGDTEIVVELDPNPQRHSSDCTQIAKEWSQIAAFGLSLSSVPFFRQAQFTTVSNQLHGGNGSGGRSVPIGTQNRTSLPGNKLRR